MGWKSNRGYNFHDIREVPIYLFFVRVISLNVYSRRGKSTAAQMLYSLETGERHAIGTKKANTELFKRIAADYAAGKVARWFEKQSGDDEATRSALMIDIDAYFENNKRPISVAAVESLVRSICEHIAERIRLSNVELDDDGNPMFGVDFHCVCIRKPAVRKQLAADRYVNELHYDSTKKKFKDGMHFIFPELQLTKSQRKYLIASLIENEIAANWAAKHKLPIVDAAGLIDRNSAHVPVLLLGSAKPGRNYFYPIENMYSYSEGELSGGEYSTPNINWPLELAVNNWGCGKLFDKNKQYVLTDVATTEQHEYKKKHDAERKKQEKYRLSDAAIANIKENEDTIKPLIREILDAIHKRSDDTGEWRGVLKALVWFEHVAEYDATDMMNLFIYFSQLSSSYNLDDDELAEHYQRYADSEAASNNALCGFTILLYWLRIDDSAAYSQIAPKMRRFLPYCSTYADSYFNDIEVYIKPASSGEQYTISQIYDFFYHNVVFVNSANPPFYVREFDIQPRLGVKYAKWVPHTIQKINQVLKHVVNIRVRKGIQKQETTNKKGKRVVEYTPIIEDDEQPIDILEVCDSYCDEFVGMSEEELPREKTFEIITKCEKLTKLFSNWIQGYANRSPIRTYGCVRAEPIDYSDNSRVFNIWQGFTIASFVATEDIDYQDTLIKQHIDKIICAGNQESQEYVHKYIAHIIQKPYEVPGVCLFLYSSKRGIGKGLFCEVLQALTGYEKYIQIDSMINFLEDKFNSELVGRLICHFDEGSTKGLTLDQANRLKSMITTKTGRINGKGVDAYVGNNFLRYIISSNYENAIYIEPDERRYLALEVSNERWRDHAYMERLSAEILNKNVIRAMYDYYAALDISDWNPSKFPVTDLFKRIKVASFNSAWRFVIDELIDSLEEEYADGRLEGDSHVWHIGQSELFQHYRRWVESIGENTKEKLATFVDNLSKLGIKCMQKRSDEGKRVRVFVVDRVATDAAVAGILGRTEQAPEQ